MIQTCIRCNETKPIEAFVKASRNKTGYTRRCKTCHQAICQNYILNNPEKRLESSRNYYATHRTEHNARTVNWAKRHPKRVRELRRKSRAIRSEEQISRDRAAAVTAMRKTRERHPNHYKARNKVNNAVARGLLPRIKTLRCEYCSQPAQAYHHHLGYAPENWLSVEPVCTRCHGLLDYPITFINDDTDILPPTYL